MKNFKSFTMAEILISLTIIGVIAAITLPALQANINENAWRAQRKALYSRISQALSMLPSLNGYGDFVGEWDNDVVTPTTDTAAERFVTDGLAKVLNINNICSIPMSMTNATDRHKELEKCGIPEKLTNMANSKLPFPTKLSELNPMFTSTYSYNNGASHRNPQKNIDTSAAAFETKNGESIAIFYNPFCRPNREETDWKSAQPYMCANFIYDFNGKKGPNKFGKDIGFITALYPVEPEVVAPMPLAKDAKNGNADTMKQTEAAAACRTQDENSRVPNRDELAAMFYNEIYIGTGRMNNYWSGTFAPENQGWIHHFGAGDRSLIGSSNKANVRCIKR